MLPFFRLLSELFQKTSRKSSMIFPLADCDQDTALLLEQYRILSDNRIHHDTMFWEVPLMFFTAQSFLFLIISDYINMDLWARIIAAFISCLFGLLCIQVFEKDRMMEIADAEQLEDIERVLIQRGYAGLIVHSTPDKRTYFDGRILEDQMEGNHKLNFLSRVSSYTVWRIGLWATTSISFVVCLYLFLQHFGVVFGWFSIYEHQMLLSVYGIIGVLTILYYLILYMFFAQRKSKAKYLLGMILVSIIYIGIITYVLVSSGALIFDPKYWIATLIAAVVILGVPPFVNFIIKARKKQNKQKQALNLKENSQIVSIILAGGKSKRLHALLNGRNKCLAIKSNGVTLLEHAIRRARAVADNYFIVTSPDTAKEIRQLLPQIKRDILFQEAQSLGTAPAILFALRTLAEKKDEICTEKDQEKDEFDPVVIIMPADHIIQPLFVYAALLKQICKMAKYFNKMYLIGIDPAFPSKDFGYFSLKDPKEEAGYDIDEFVEKPSASKAAELVNCDKLKYYWNSGIFVVRYSVLLRYFENVEGIDWDKLLSGSSVPYDNIPEPISFDKVILEKAENLQGIPANFLWMDIGNEYTLEQAMLQGLVNALDVPKP